MWTRWTHFWTEELWNVRLSDLPKGQAAWYRFLRLMALSVRGFIADRCTLRASSLSYYTMLSIVPMLAIFFAIARGFGMQETLREALLEKFQEHESAFVEIMSFAEKLLEQTKTGLIAGIGAVLLFWTAIQLLLNIEEALNYIWDIERKRSIRRMVTDYFAWLFLAPILFILSTSASVVILRYTASWMGEFKWLFFFVQLLPYTFFWFFFSFCYYFIPNAKVRYASAFIGGMVAGTSYFLVQWGYIHFQIGVSRYSAIYGSFAALPLFLLWIQISWFLLFFGAEVSHAHQTLESHELSPAVSRASPHVQRVVGLWILGLVIQRFKEKSEPTPFSWLIRHCRIPAVLATSVLKTLCEAKLLIEIPEQSYVPARSIETLRIADAIVAIELKGLSLAELPFFHAKELKALEKALHSFQTSIERSDQNCLLSEIFHKV